jgi:hypothetical protein
MDMIATTFDTADVPFRGVETAFRDRTDTTKEYYENRHSEALEAPALRGILQWSATWSAGNSIEISRQEDGRFWCADF